MQLTKFGHSCLRLEKDGKVLVIDPGVFSEPVKALEGADAVLITHEHPDHIDVDVLRAAAQLNPELHIWAPSSVTDTLSDLGKRVTTSAAEQEIDAVGFNVTTFGGQHALIHSSVPLVANVCYLVDGSVYHPGDSFTVPNAEVEYLSVPIHAPWSKMAEVIDFTVAVRAKRAFQIHDGLLNDIGRGMVEAQVTRVGGQYGSVFTHLDVGESIEA